MKLSDIKARVNDMDGNKPDHEKAPGLLRGIFDVLCEIHGELEKSRRDRDGK